MREKIGIKIWGYVRFVNVDMVLCCVTAFVNGHCTGVAKKKKENILFSNKSG